MIKMNIASLTLFSVYFCLATGSHAQETPTPTVEEPVAGTQVDAPASEIVSEVPENAELLQCEKDKKALAIIVTNSTCQGCSVTTELTQKLTELANCEDDEALSRKTNLSLKRQLDLCRKRPTCDTSHESANEARIRQLEGEVQLARNQAAKSQADFDKALRRLTENGLSLEPTFSFHLDDSYDSFVDGVAMERATTASNRLQARNCESAQQWLSSQEFVRRTIWVWQKSRPVLCKPVAGGGYTLKNAKGNDEAHLIFFK